MKSRSLLLVFTIFLLSVLSCKKDLPDTTEQSGRLETQRLKDSIYHYYHLYSLWSDGVLPADEAVFAFTDQFDSPKDVLDAMKSQTNIDRFSYMENLNDADDQSSDPVNLNHGFGIFASIGAVNEQVAYPVIYFVTGGSPAAQAGIKRSDVILGIDEYLDFSIPVSCGTSGCKVIDDNVKQAVTNRLLGAMKQKSMTLRLRHADGTESTVTINAFPFELDPIIKHKVFVYPSKSVGYLALSSFEDISAGKQFRQQLDQVFSGFEQQQVTELVFDLRYNSGGQVRTAEYIANKVAGPGVDKALMFKYILNDYLSSRTGLWAEQFNDVYFKVNHALKINTVYFLVTDITASASELLINVLKPYMNVIVIANHKGTYGKPVGSFRQEIMGNTNLWVASFKMVNARGDTDYWDGIEADQKNVTDYIFSDFGDEGETMLSAALQHATGKVSALHTGRSAVVRKIKMDNVNSMPRNMMVR